MTWCNLLVLNKLLREVCMKKLTPRARWRAGAGWMSPVLFEGREEEEEGWRREVSRLSWLPVKNFLQLDIWF